MTNQIRHGDVFIKRVGEAPQKVVNNGDKKPALAEGEVSGHYHRVYGPDICFFVDTERMEKERGMMDGSATSYAGDLLVGGGGASVKHVDRTEALTGEHGTVALAPGSYKIVHQREYSPEKDLRVAD